MKESPNLSQLKKILRIMKEYDEIMENKKYIKDELTITCPVCGTDLDNDIKFCINCGSFLKKDIQEKV
ncbi:MAG: zinc-ribbon domain-containing protein [Candidatus Helarchaeota archaeon]